SCASNEVHGIWAATDTVSIEPGKVRAWTAKWRGHAHLPLPPIALAIATTVCLGAGGAGATTYPLQASTNGRYLVDQNHAPYLMVGDAPQALTVNISEAEAEMYFANRSAHGFNTLWVNLLCATYTGGRADGSTIDGILPFTGTIPSTSSYDLETPNEAFF